MCDICEVRGLSKVNGITGQYDCKSKFRENLHRKSRISTI